MIFLIPTCTKLTVTIATYRQGVRSERQIDGGDPQHMTPAQAIARIRREAEAIGPGGSISVRFGAAHTAEVNATMRIDRRGDELPAIVASVQCYRGPVPLPENTVDAWIAALTERLTQHEAAQAAAPTTAANA